MLVSAFGIAKSQLEEACRQARAGGVDEELLLRALIGSVVERYRTLKGVDDLRAVLTYQLENVRGDEDHEFMRP
jgi:hypothetical protein